MKQNIHKTKKLPNGNVALYYQIRWPMEKPWIITSIALILIGCFLLEYLFKSTTYSLVPLSILFCIIFMYWMMYPCKNNEKLEEMWLDKNVDLRLHNALRDYKVKVYEVKRKYYQVTVGTYGKVVGTYMLILLSNGEVLEYELKYNRATKMEDAYHELFRSPRICKDKERIKAIKGWSPAQWWKMNINTQKNYSILCITLFFLASIGLTALGVWLCVTLKEKIIYAIFGYMAFYFAFQHCLRKKKNHILRYIDIIVSIPFVTLYVWISLAHPIITILASYLFTALFAFGIPAITLKGLEHFFGWELASTTILFSSLSIGSITCVFFSKIIQWMIKNKSPLRDWGNHKYEAIREDLSLYLLDSSNINFLIYLAYFSFLILSSYMHFQNNTPLIHPKFDEAVLKAFLVFIAYSNVVKYSKDIKFDSKTFIGKISKLIFTHDE